MLGLAFAALQLASASPPARPPVYNGQKGELTVALPRIEGSDAVVNVDGVLDEPVWQRAALLTGFSLYSPVDSSAGARLDRRARLVFVGQRSTSEFARSSRTAE